MLIVSSHRMHGFLGSTHSRFYDNHAQYIHTFIGMWSGHVASIASGTRSTASDSITTVSKEVNGCMNEYSTLIRYRKQGMEHGMTVCLQRGLSSLALADSLQSRSPILYQEGRSSFHGIPTPNLSFARSWTVLE